MDDFVAIQLKFIFFGSQFVCMSDKFLVIYGVFYDVFDFFVRRFRKQGSDRGVKF